VPCVACWTTSTRGFPRCRVSTGRRIGLVTGTRMAPVLEPLAERLSRTLGGSVEVVAVRNAYFGETVRRPACSRVRDMERRCARAAPFDAALLPAESLNDDDLFIDSMPLAALRHTFAGRDLRPRTS
jgi:hypothetical protein